MKQQSYRTAAAAIMLAFSTFGQTAGFDQVAKRAAEAREAHRLDEAISLYKKAVALRPSWAEGWWYLGSMYYETDRYPDARDAYGKVTALEPKRGDAWAMLGLCEYQTRDYGTAIRHLEMGTELGLGGNRNLANVVHYHRAILLNRFGQFEAALADLLPFAQEGNTNPTVIEAFGVSALRMLFLPREIPPDKRDLVLKAGWANYYFTAQRAEEAKRAFEELAAAYPNESNVHYAYGLSLLQADPDAALREFRKELEITPAHVPARLQIAFEYLKRGEPESGLKPAQEAVELDPRLFIGHHALGRIYLEMGDLQKAIGELERTVKLAPESPQAHFALATAYARAGKHEEAARERAEFTRLEKLRKK